MSALARAGMLCGAHLHICHVSEDTSRTARIAYVYGERGVARHDLLEALSAGLLREAHRGDDRCHDHVGAAAHEAV